MSDRFFDRLESTARRLGPLCVGLDPSSSLLAAWHLDDDAAGAERLVRTVLEAIEGTVGIVKPQVAFFERHGSAGFAVLERVIVEARAAGMLVVADAKRGDIPSTNEGYAQAWMRDASPFAVDAVTVSCYLGSAALAPVFTEAHASGRGVFCVVASSNDEGRTIQTAHLDPACTVEEGLLAELDAINGSVSGDGGDARCAGAVIGAQRRLDGLPGFTGPVLIVGLGTQGCTLEDVAALRSTISHDAICVNVARDVLRAGPDRAAVRAAAEGLAASLR
jgi:orotidine-5'-phosphate decarboxylase